MVIELKKYQRERLWPLIGTWPQSMLRTCLQGYDGRAWCCGESAALQVRDFCFFAGRPSEKLVRTLEPELAGKILVPQHEPWERMLEVCVGHRAKAGERYAILKEPEAFCRDNLNRLISALPEGYVLQPFDAALYAQAEAMEWSADHRPIMELGMAVVHGGKLVSAASPYSRYDGGIEVQIDTHPCEQRRGLATACGAALILQCMDRGLYPSWDAAHMGSVRLAERLGYHLDQAYRIFRL